MKVFSIIILIFLTLLIVFLAAYLIVLRFMFYKCFGRQNNPEKRIEQKSKLLDMYKIDFCWWKKQKKDELIVVNNEGLKLHAFYLENNSKKTAIVVHGYRCDYREMSSYAKMFFNMGYNVLVTVNRGHGKSEGFIGMGYLDKNDILAWVNVMINKKTDTKIVLFGLSMGGTAVCMAAGEKLPNNVICIISDCAFENVYKQIAYVFNKKNSKFKLNLLNAFSKYIQKAYDFNLKEADAGLSLKNTTLPVMLIHGKEDNYVPINSALRLEERLPIYKKSIYFVESADHAMSYAVNQKKYEAKIREFLKKFGM